MISPYNPDRVNAASYDVVIGDKIKIIRASSIRYKTVRVKASAGISEFTEMRLVPIYDTFEFDDIDLSQGQTEYLYQGDFSLTETDNFFHIPRNISAQFALKSSRGREGYGHALAGFIDPKWHNSKLTLEMFNHNPSPIPIYKGLRIGQIIFSRCDAQPIKAYDERGRYNNDNGVRESKG
jgi:dCTP deaminase